MDMCDVRVRCVVDLWLNGWMCAGGCDGHAREHGGGHGRCAKSSLHTHNKNKQRSLNYPFRSRLDTLLLIIYIFAINQTNKQSLKYLIHAKGVFICTYRHKNLPAHINTNKSELKKN